MIAAFGDGLLIKQADAEDAQRTKRDAISHEKKITRQTRHLKRDQVSETTRGIQLNINT